MPSIKNRRRAKRRAEKLVEESLDALDSGHAALADKLIQRALSAGPANARFWLEYARISQHRGFDALVDDRPGKRKRIRVLPTDIGDAIIFCARDRLTPIAGLYGRQ